MGVLSTCDPQVLFNSFYKELFAHPAGKQDALLHTVSSLLFFVLLEFLSEFAATHCKGYVKALCLNFVSFGGPVLGVGLYFIAVVLLVPRRTSPSRSIAALTASARSVRQVPHLPQMRRVKL